LLKSFCLGFINKVFRHGGLKPTRTPVRKLFVGGLLQ